MSHSSLSLILQHVASPPFWSSANLEGVVVSALGFICTFWVMHIPVVLGIGCAVTECQAKSLPLS